LGYFSLGNPKKNSRPWGNPPGPRPVLNFGKTLINTGEGFSLFFTNLQGKPTLGGKGFSPFWGPNPHGPGYPLKTGGKGGGKRIPPSFFCFFPPAFFFFPGGGFTDKKRGGGKVCMFPQRGEFGPTFKNSAKTFPRGGGGGKTSPFQRTTKPGGKPASGGGFGLTSTSSLLIDPHWGDGFNRVCFNFFWD